MTPVAIASLAALVGLFTVLDARSADRRLVLAGLSARSLLTARLSVVALGALIATAASVAVTAVLFDARQWALYLAANALTGLTYGLIGVLIGSLFGRVGGVFVAFLVPFLDLGIEQSPMLNSEVSGLGHAMPGLRNLPGPVRRRAHHLLRREGPTTHRPRLGHRPRTRRRPAVPPRRTHRRQLTVPDGRWRPAAGCALLGPLLDRTYRRLRRAIVAFAVVLLLALIARTVEVRAWEGATGSPAKEK